MPRTYVTPCNDISVMAGLDPAIHAFRPKKGSKTWITGTSPVMTAREGLSDLPPWRNCLQ